MSYVQYTREMRSIMGRARAGYDGISSHSPKRINLKTLYKMNMNENACICPWSNGVSARALENVDPKRVMSTAASIATLTWHDLEPKMLDEQFLVPMVNLILCFKLNFAIFCGYIWVKN